MLFEIAICVMIFIWRDDMSKQTWKGGAMLSPVPPAMVSCGDMDNANILTIGWTGIMNTQPPMTYISVRPERYSYNIIKESGEFVINLATKDLVYACDYCGVRSGKEHDKFSEMKLTKAPASQVSAPLIEQSPISLECKVKEVVHLGTHDMFIADIVAVDVDEKVIDKDGRLMIEKCDLIAYAHGRYFELGKCLGSFGYSVRKNKTKKKHHTRRKG